MSNSLYPVRVEIDPKTVEKLNRVYTRAYTEVVSELKSGDKYNTAQRRSIVQSINRALTDLQKETNGILEQDIPKQYNTGKQDAAKQLNNLNVKPQTSFTLIDKEAVASLVDETSRAFAESIRATGRNSEYLLNKVSKEVIREEMAVSKTRGEALKKATARIKGIIEDEGISALTDKGGKQWTLDRYAEMLYRTKSVEARNTGLINSMIQNDFDLVQVSDHTGECQMCAPWEGKILSISGRTAGYPTLAEAESAGLFHPNCRHAINTIHPSLARRTKAYNPDMETQYVPPSEQKRVARVKNPNPRGATNLVQINDELSIRKPSSKNDIKRLNESVRYNAAFQLEGSRSIAGVQGIGDDVIRAIDAVDVSKANNPIEAGNLILKGLPAKYQSSDVVTNTVKQWAQTQQNIFNAKNLAARQSASQSAYTVYRGTGGTYGKGQAVLGRGKYVAMNKANAEQYGDVITKYRLSAQANILDLQDGNALSNFQSEAIAKHADKYAKLLETNTSDKAIAEVMRDHATQLGFDAIRGDDKAYGMVVFKESLLVPIE